MKTNYNSKVAISRSISRRILILVNSLILGILVQTMGCALLDGSLGGDSSSSEEGGGGSSSSGGGQQGVCGGSWTPKSVVIGTQTWMSENLNCIPSTGNYWCYDNKPENCEKYGRLYDYATAMALPEKCNEKAAHISTSSPFYDEDCKAISPHQGICPNGWHIPDDDEWLILAKYADPGIISANSIKNNVAGKKLKAKSGWGGSGNGTDDFGFAALPSGAYGRLSEGDEEAMFRWGSEHTFPSGIWYSTSVLSNDVFSFNENANSRRSWNVGKDNDEISTTGTQSNVARKSTGIAIRCVRDK